MLDVKLNSKIVLYIISPIHTFVSTILLWIRKITHDGEKNQVVGRCFWSHCFPRPKNGGGKIISLIGHVNQFLRLNTTFFGLAPPVRRRCYKIKDVKKY